MEVYNTDFSLTKRLFCRYDFFPVQKSKYKKGMNDVWSK